MVYEGPVAGLLAEPRSKTGMYLAGLLAMPGPARRRRARPRDGASSSAAPVRTTSRDVTVGVPLGLLVCVTGVSGSGKSSLVDQVLHRNLRRHFGLGESEPGACDGIDGASALTGVTLVDQAPLGASSRVNAATYMGVLEPLRKVFAKTPEARERGLEPTAFSFNSAAGRLPGLRGRGLREGRDAVPAGRLREVRGLRRPPLPARGARGALPGPLDRGRARPARGRRRAPLRRRPRGAPGPPAHARPRPRLPVALPAGADALGRRGAAAQARAGAGRGGHGAGAALPARRADDRPARRGRGRPRRGDAPPRGRRPLRRRRRAQHGGGPRLRLGPGPGPRGRGGGGADRRRGDAGADREARHADRAGSRRGLPGGAGRDREGTGTGARAAPALRPRLARARRGLHPHRRRARAQPAAGERRHPARQAGGRDRRLGLRQVDPRLRRALRRGPAALPRLPLDLRAPVHPAARPARGGPPRGRPAHRRPGAEALARHAALDRGHRERGLPPPAPPLVPPRHGPLPEVRAGRAGGGRGRSRRARRGGLPCRRPDRPRASRPQAQGLPPGRDRRRGEEGRLEVRIDGTLHDAAKPPRIDRFQIHDVEAVVARLSRGRAGSPKRASRRARARPRQLPGAGRGDRAGAGAGQRHRRGPGRRHRALLLDPPLLPELRHGPPRPRPAPVLVEPEVRGLSRVRRLRRAARRGGRRDAPGRGGRLPRLRRDAPAARGPGGEDRRPAHRRGRRAHRGRGPRLARDAGGAAARGGARARLARADAAPRPPRPPRPRLPHARARGRHALDRRGAAHPHRGGARLQPARGLLRPRRADGGPAPARRRGAHEGPPRPARPRQHGRGGRARGERHPRRRPRRRPRARGGAARRAARGARARRSRSRG